MKTFFCLAVLILVGAAVETGEKKDTNAEDTKVPVSTPFTCPMYTDEYGDLYNVNGLANGGEGHFVPHGEKKYFRIAFCETFTTRYKHSECANDTAVCFAEKTGDNQFVGYNIGDAKTFTFRTIQEKDVVLDGVAISMTGTQKPPSCAAGTLPTTHINLLCDEQKYYPKIEFESLDTATCTYTFKGTAREACSLSRCPVYSNKYGTINLNYLNDGGAFTIPAKDGQNAITMTMCGSLRASASNCTTEGVAVCEHWDGPPGHKNWKDVASAIGWNTLPGDDSGEPKSVILETGFGEFSNSCENANRAIITVHCDESMTGPAAFSFESKQDCNWYFTSYHHSACIVYEHSGPGVFVGDHWLSAGSVLLIIFFVGGAIYLFVGAGVNYAQGKRGGEMIPNRDTWRALFMLSMEGWSFTIGKCTGKSSSNLYDTV